MKKVKRRQGHAKWNHPIQTLGDEDLEQLLEREEEPFLLVLDEVQDPHNLGACLRSADAAGCHAVISPRHRAAPITETVRHVASGAAESIPFIQVSNLARTLDSFRDRFIRIVGTGDEESQSLYSVDLTGPLALVMGAEGTGIRRLTAEKCDHLIAIPMRGSVDCLNVSVATGVCLFEALRQRD